MLYGDGARPWLTRAVALGVHLLALAKSTCHWVGGPTRVVVGMYNGLRLYELEDVEVLEERARKFSEALAELTLALPDVSTSEGSFIEVLGAFEERVLALRGYYLRRLAQSVAEQMSKDTSALTAQLPLNTPIQIDGMRNLTVSKSHVEIRLGSSAPEQSDSETSEGQP
jgi:hypothetical protein